MNNKFKIQSDKLCPLKPHVNTIVSRVNVPDCEDNTWRANFPVSSPQLFVPPENILAVGSLPKTICWIVWLLSPNITSGPYRHDQNISVSTSVRKCHEWCDTSDFLATLVFLFCWHRLTNSTCAPWGLGHRGIWRLTAKFHKVLGIVKATFSVWQNLKEYFVFLLNC